MRADIVTAGGKNLLAMRLWSWERVFNAPMRDLIYPEVVPTVDKLANVCLEGIFDIEPRKAVGNLLQERFLRVDDPDKHRAMARSSCGKHRHCRWRRV
jgi:hypothetical protein